VLQKIGKTAPGIRVNEIPVQRVERGILEHLYIKSVEVLILVKLDNGVVIIDLYINISLLFIPEELGFGQEQGVLPVLVNIIAVVCRDDFVVRE